MSRRITLVTLVLASLLASATVAAATMEELEDIHFMTFDDGAPGSGKRSSPIPVAVGMLLFGIVTIVVTALIVKAKQGRDGRLWGVAARQLGMRLEPWDPRFLSDFDRMRTSAGGAVAAPDGPVTSQAMRGSVRGVPATVNVHRSSGQDPLTGASINSFTTTCRAYFPAPLGMQLAIGEQGFMAGLVGDMLGTQSLPTGDPRFDQLFRVVAADPHRARAFVAHLGPDLVRVASDGHKVSVSDLCVAVELGGLVTDSRRIGAALEAAAFLVQRLGPPR